MRRRMLVVALLGLAAALAPARAEELWVAPAEAANVAVGDWALTPSGEAHFTFAVPDDLDRFLGAQVLVLGARNRQISYDLSLSITADGAAHDAFEADEAGLPGTIEAGEVTALDASSLFPALAAGEDVVGLHFRATPPAHLRVIGLRVQYLRFPDQAGLGCGPREVLVGFAPETGEPICVGRNLLLEGLLCPPGQFLIGFDPVTGNLRCGDKRVLLAGLECPTGQFLVGFDDTTGDLVCKTFDGVVGPGGGGGDGVLIVVGNVELPEGQAGTTPFVFTVELSAASASPVTVDFATRDGAAESGSDYIATSGTLTFAPGELSKTITVLVNGDTTIEDTEFFFVDLSSPSGATLGDSVGTGLIFNDDHDGSGDGRG